MHFFLFNCICGGYLLDCLFNGWMVLKQILAALLHMGNIKYQGKVVDNLDATDIPDTSNVERVAAILGVQKQSLGRRGSML